MSLSLILGCMFLHGPRVNDRGNVSCCASFALPLSDIVGLVSKHSDLFRV